MRDVLGRSDRLRAAALKPGAGRELLHAVPRHLVRVESRFWRAVKRTEGCWLWTAALGATGYGAMFVQGRTVAAHRVSWTLLRGPIHDGDRVAHLCAERTCVRPEHLEVREQLQSGRRRAPPAKRPAPAP